MLSPEGEKTAAAVAAVCRKWRTATHEGEGRSAFLLPVRKALKLTALALMLALMLTSAVGGGGVYIYYRHYSQCPDFWLLRVLLLLSLLLLLLMRSLLLVFLLSREQLVTFRHDTVICLFCRFFLPPPVHHYRTGRLLNRAGQGREE